MAKTMSPLSVGKAVIIRTVTHYFTGRIKAINTHEVILNDAAWVADTGRWHNALKDGILNEIEPFVGLVSINRNAIVDVTEWKHALPRQQK